MLVNIEDERALDSSLTGGKGSTLAMLTAEGFPVPPGFVITTNAFDKFLKERNLKAEVRALFDVSSEPVSDTLENVVKSLQERIQNSSLPQMVSERLARRLGESAGEFQGETQWAVRSSAVAEDLTEASFAGQYDTILAVSGFKGLAKAILQCWASFFNLHAIQYRLDRDIREFRGAVIVQHLIHPEAAGVCFTVDPLTGTADTIVINSHFGLGESVVSGHVTPDTFMVDRVTRQIISRNISIKDKRMVPTASGVHEKAIVESDQRKPSLTDYQVREVTELAVKVEESVSCPVDVEWAVSEGKVYLLQSRPITVFPIVNESIAPSPPDDWVPELNTPIDPRYPLYSNGNISEILPGCITPLSWSYIGPSIEHGFRSQGTVLGSIQKSGPEYQALGFFYHRPYICVSFLEEAAARTPGMTPDTIHEEFIGPPETSTPPFSLSDFRPDRWPAIVRVLLTILRKTRTLARDAENCMQTFFRQQKDSTPEKLKDWSDERLIEEVGFTVEMAFLSDVHIWASGLAVMYFALLRKLTKAWLDDDNGSLAAQMVTGIGSLASAHPAFGLYKLARDVRLSPGVRMHFNSIDDNQLLLEALEADEIAANFAMELKEFLNVHGHRAVCEAEFRNPCWREDPAQVLGLIRNYLQPGSTPPEEIRMKQDRIRTEAAKRIKSLSLLKRIILNHTLKAARRYIELREALKDLIVLRSDRARRIYAETSKHLISRGRLSEPDDLYFLVWNEVRDLLAGKMGSDKVKDIISRRRQDFEWSQKVQLPKIIDGEIKVITEGDFVSDQHWKGLGVSPGTVEGRARVILDPRVESHIEPGEILIAPVTDAGWTPLFINAAGLVVEVGGLLSHGSIVAREYGLPAVVGVSRATQQIRTGDRIYLDGSSGAVVKLN